MKKRVFLILFSIFLFSQSAYGYWIWTPESKKWTNPKYAPKESPQEQLKFALGYFEIKDYQTAYNEFKKLVKYYPDALEAPEAQFYMGRCLEETEKYYEAFQAYQKVIDKYPFTERTEDILQQEYIVAQKLLDYRKNVVGINFTGETAALEVFRKIIENAPYGKYAAASQYKIGLTLKAKGDFTEATAEFQKVLDNYPTSEWAEPAKFQIAVCAGRSSLDASYDQTMTQEAVDRFKTFLATHPDAELSEQAELRIDELRDKEAESNFEIGRFYEKQKAFDSAKIYYQFVIKNYPRSIWAQKSLERIKTLENKDK
ncbi:MAG: outer membrane protein assembly factor BamD [Candidatus Omnitrophica bacterium]|nr:outer membrane protein assembly factor BamD [Candidatus Omnitrophota bacterium]MDD5574266.1 outer membrane protein assembly factor BamD [Candidatus Omnitrophota bacterium]